MHKLGWVLLVLCVFSSVAMAQEARGTILGRVTDATGGVIPGAEIRAINVATQAAAVARTNDVGNYTIPFLLPGAYRVTVEGQGFKKFQRDNVELRVNDTLELNIELTVGNVTETVEVREETPLLETATASLGQVVDSRRVQELPIQAGNAFELVLLRLASPTPPTCVCARRVSTTRRRRSPPTGMRSFRTSSA